MKIIGKAERGVFILRANEDEIAQLIGYRSEYERRDDSRRYELVVGDEICVTAMFSRLYSLEARKGELERLAKQLRAQADLLESVEPVIAAATAEGSSP